VKKARTGTKPRNLLHLSPALSQLLDGELQLTRGDVMKRLWQYIKQHGLQDSKNGRRILLDDPLKAVFGKEKRSVEMFKMTSLLSKHLYKDHEV
jgi:upstream activation factor subunit UAF30